MADMDKVCHLRKRTALPVKREYRLYDLFPGRCLFYTVCVHMKTLSCRVKIRSYIFK